MRLTHHHKSSRSFILLVTIVLCTVFAALVMTRIQRLYDVKPQLQIKQTEAPSDEQVNFDYISNVTEWKEYIDPAFPLKINIPKEWNVVPNTEYSIDRHLELQIPDGRTVIRIFISEESYVAVEGLDGEIEETSTGDDVINYDGIIFATRVGDYYYTYDATSDLNAKDILAKIVDTAEYQ